MSRFLHEAALVATINLRSLDRRPLATISTGLAIALVVVVLQAFLALAAGFERTLAQAGNATVAVILRGGAQAEINSAISREQLEIVRGGPGIESLSAEVNLLVDAYRRSDGQRMNLSLRGLQNAGTALRDDLRIIRGRLFQPGASELVVGNTTARLYRDFEVGSVVNLGTTQWTVVGIFDTQGSAAESEIWGDLGAVQGLFDRQSSFQSLRVRLASTQALAELQDYLDADPRLSLSIQSERAYFAVQAARTFDLIHKLGWPLALVMAIGALVAAMNAMYTAVAHRTREIATLRALGFSPGATFFGAMAQALCIALMGAIVGTAIAWLVFDGMSASTLGSGVMQVGFRLALTPLVLIQGIALACAIGLLGGLLPALRAARMPIVQGL
ncbi:ABC transporter permease [Pseudomonas piscis]|uniref:ABC transporter permease n=1 Tax=Pseudomonas piscis TaxID=2614538 RepID=UPI0021D5771E|nr:ABC transporter permease [Pseudomonas piscis]MCU7650482.1 ABC transporter permease [Pseudomonas piscis]